LPAPLSGAQRLTLGAGNNYDTWDCVDELRCANTMPHIARNTSNRSSVINGHTTSYEGYAVGQAKPAVFPQPVLA
jgi:hypothetical protein